MTLPILLRHPLITEMVIKGIEPTIKAGGLSISGFYKSDTVLLYFDIQKDGLVAEDRYGDKTEIETLRDLVELNLLWWAASANRSPTWLHPQQPWRDIAIEMGLLEAKETIITEYVGYD